MKAVILAGGRGKRLRPITDHIPKPLVPIRDKPIIEWQLEYLRGFGIDEAIICTGYKQDMIEHYLSVKKHGIRLRYSAEKTPLGTGGAIKKAGGMIGEESFFVINGDVITDIDLKRLSNTENSIASIGLRTKFGIMETDGDEITDFREKGEVPNLWMNAGIYRLQSSILRDLPEEGDIEKTVFPDYAKKGRLHMTRFRNVQWYSIDSFKDMEDCASNMERAVR